MDHERCGLLLYLMTGWGWGGSREVWPSPVLDDRMGVGWITRGVAFSYT